MEILPQYVGSNYYYFLSVLHIADVTSFTCFNYKSNLQQLCIICNTDSLLSSVFLCVCVCAYQTGNILLRTVLQMKSSSISARRKILAPLWWSCGCVYMGDARFSFTWMRVWNLWLDCVCVWSNIYIVQQTRLTACPTVKHEQVQHQNLQLQQVCRQ